MAFIIDGKSIAKQVREDLKQKIGQLKEQGIVPGLAVVLVGDDPASAIYVRNKTKACSQVGITHFDHFLPANTSSEELLKLIHTLNHDPKVHGILVQLPLPSGLDAPTILRAVDPKKDADGIHPYNTGRLLAGDPQFLPCTPMGVMHMLRQAETQFPGAEAVVVGRSIIVGKPMALLLLAENCTVTICHSKTVNLPQIISRADILIAAVGRPELIKGEWIKKGATVIDVGSNRLGDKVVGDVEFDAAASRARAISPVPGGVGPMTIAMLLFNTVKAAAESASNL